MKAMQAFWQLLQQAPRRRVLALLLCMTAAGLTEGVGLLLLVPLLEVLDGQRSHNPLVQQLLNALTALGLPASVGGLLLAFVALVALRSAVQYARERLGASLQQHLVDQLRLRCFAALLAVEWRWLVNTRRADHANLLLTDVSRVGVGLHFGLGLLATAATLLAYLAVAFALSWRMSLLALAGGVLVFGLLSGQRNRAMQLGKNLSQASRALHGNVQESLAGIKLAKILATEPAQLDFFTRTTERLRTQQLEFVADTSASRALFQFGGAALLAAYLYLGLSVWQTPVPLLLTLVLVFSRLIPMLMSVHQQMHRWLHALPALQQTQDLLAQCQRHAEPGFGVADADHTAPAALSLTQTICLDAVSVTYAERERPALANISL